MAGESVQAAVQSVGWCGGEWGHDWARRCEVGEWLMTKETQRHSGTRRWQRGDGALDSAGVLWRKRGVWGVRPRGGRGYRQQRVLADAPAVV